jgi:excinuclease UvrABC ATPase subunit
MSATVNDISRSAEYRYKEHNIADILEMSVSQVLGFFDNKRIKQAVKIMEDVGLDY